MCLGATRYAQTALNAPHVLGTDFKKRKKKTEKERKESKFFWGGNHLPVEFADTLSL